MGFIKIYVGICGLGWAREDDVVKVWGKMSNNEQDLAISVANAPASHRLRKLRRSLNIFTLGYALIATNVFLFVGAWCLAWKNGAIPDNWGYHEGNHGPWRFWDGPGHASGELLNLAFYCTFGVLLVGFLSLVRKPVWKGLMILAAGFMLGYVFLEHYWLID